MIKTVQGLKPIYDNNSKILILGSLPSEKSIKNQEYYNNQTNHFWKIISFVTEKRIINFSNYQDKISFLKKHQIALWDVISTANRVGSLDQNIKNEQYNDLYQFITKHKITKIFVNGNKADKSFKKYLKQNKLNIEYKVLTSSSAANTKYTLKEKINIWSNIIKNNS